MKEISLGVFMLLFIFVTSCNDDIISIDEHQASISFDINNLNKSAKKSNFNKGPADGEKLPECIDGAASYVEVFISGSIGDNVKYTLKVLNNLGNGTETEVVKLPVGEYAINSFVAYTEDGTELWAAVANESYYDTLFDLKSVDLPFLVEDFEKHKVNIDVLCYQPFDYENFGFEWFQFSKTEIKTVCFFGDICTECFEDFHKGDSPYFGQDYDGYDFAAIFDVEIYDVNNNLLNKGSNIDWQGVGNPLCLEYPDRVGVDETFSFKIFLHMPDGEKELIIENTFTDKQWADKGNPDGFGGEDGIFDFVAGECSYSGNVVDAVVDLPYDCSSTTPGEDSCETAFAKFDKSFDFGTGYVFTSKAADNPEDYDSLGIGTRWGWAGNITDAGTTYSYTFDLWAAAGKNDTSKGTDVGDVTFVKESDGTYTVTFNVESGYYLKEAHVYAENTAPTVTAPGKYGNVIEFGDNHTKTTYSFTGLSNGGWFIAHATVCGDYE